MQLGVKLRPSRTKDQHDPGHMGVYWKVGGRLEFRGFYFSPMDLPLEFRKPERYRDFLFDNAVPGYVIEDIILRKDYELRSEALLCKSWRISNAKINELEIEARPREHGKYSFNPDRNFCDNCVTWSVRLANQFVVNALPRVREGRIKLMEAHLEE